VKTRTTIFLAVVALVCVAAGAAADPVRIEFRFQHPTAYIVTLAGTFNGWDTGADPMSGPDPDGWWVLEKLLDPGYYEYKFVSDGGNWHTDPLNPRSNPGSFNNSILEVWDPLVYYLLPKSGTLVSDPTPLIEANLGKSDAATFGLSELAIVLDGEVVASGASYYDVATGRARFQVAEDLTNDTHEARISIALLTGGSHADSTSFEVFSDTSPPVIEHVPPAGAVANAAVHIECVITDDWGVEDATLFYRNAGDPTFVETSMLGGLSDVWTGTVPAGFTTSGTDFEYYVEASDLVNTTRLPPAGTYAVPVFDDDEPPVISDAFAAPAAFAVSGLDNNSRLSFRLSEPTTITVDVRTTDGSHRRRLHAQTALGTGYHQVLWNGHTDFGTAVSDGEYRFHVHGYDAAALPAEEVVVPVFVDGGAEEPPIDVILLFHANQTLNYQGDTANDVCFNGLLDVLRRHPDSRFMLHFSGTLLHDLGWYNFRNDPSTIDMLRAGAADGQFEIVGSTYAQNVPYSTHMWDNERQVEVQREVIETMVDVSPVSFWNAERCWKQPLVPLLAENGYTTTWVETHILYDSGTAVPDHAVRRTTLGEDEVIVFNDDGGMYWLDWAVESGDPSGLINYLGALRAEDIYGDWVACYCQDAEATGLWDYESGGDPQDDWDNLDLVLTAMEATGWIRLTTMSEVLETRRPTEDLTPIVDGQANWMVGPSQAAGYDDWFDFNDRSPTLNYYRGFYTDLRSRIQEVEALVSPGTPGANLVRHAIWSLVAHQFEFGCIGCGWIGCQDYHKGETLEGALLAAEATLSPAGGTDVSNVDANGDGEPDWVITTPSDFYIVSETGGRLVRWFDLARGELVLGNDLFMWGYYYNGWRDWHGGSGWIDDTHYMENFVWSAWNFAPAAAPFIRNYPIRKHAMNDRLSIDGSDDGVILNAHYSAEVDDDTLRLVHSQPGLRVTKEWLADGVVLSITYRIRNTGGGSHDYDLTIENELSPSLLEVMNGGRGTLQYWDGSSTTSTITPASIGVVNVLTERAVTFTFAQPPASIAGGETVHGLYFNPSFAFSLGAGEEKVIRVSLGVGPTSIESLEDGPRRLLLEQNSPNPFNPVTTIEFVLPAPGQAELSVYSAAGRKVATLLDGPMEAGPGAATWSGVDDAGRPVASGVYFFRLWHEGRSTTRKGVLLK